MSLLFFLPKIKKQTTLSPAQATNVTNWQGVTTALLLDIGTTQALVGGASIQHTSLGNPASQPHAKQHNTIVR